MLRHSAAGENSECVVFGQAVFQASHSLVPANTACYAGYARIGYGTVVQLCTVRNKRKLSASRYHGIARVTSRRARKGFAIKLNPDAHHSTALYKGLDYIQLKDGRDKVVLNRDDQAGFRLDTTFTHKLHKATSLTHQPETTTRSDYVNKYASVIQTTSAMFLGTATTSERCVGVVKAQPVHYKNPAQHAADLGMLQSKDELAPWLKNKAIDCIRVDGAGDEGPKHHEVQFLWTERHFKEDKVATLVTTRHSGGSYLNRVEMQNGCLALAHCNLFIPSTLTGSNNSSTGLDTERLLTNLDMAINVYIDRVNGAPCGKRPIALFKGAKDEHADKLQGRRQDLLTFLKGTQKLRAELQAKKPDEYNYFKKIWDLREQHMVKDLPEKYIFFLLPCYKSDCIHPVCQRGKPQEEMKWFEGGPSLIDIPLPIPDPTRPWGGNEKCTSGCHGHFMSPAECLEHIRKNGHKDCMLNPPSEVIKKSFDLSRKRKTALSAAQINDLAKQTLLPESDVSFWLQHLKGIEERRAEGVKKARATRQRSKGTVYTVHVLHFYCISN